MPACSASSSRLGGVLGGFDQAAGPRHHRGVPLAQRRLVGLAALAGAEAGRLGVGAVAWNATFSGRAGRAAQDGRQYTPVVRTE